MRIVWPAGIRGDAMFRTVKNVCWRILAAGLTRAATSLRRRPSGGGPEAWRAVHFSYAHFGEDLVVLSLLRDKLPGAKGCYIDVGAFDPILHSNTYLLYQHGWRGLNIDASPDRLARFASTRPGDTNVVAAVSDAVREMVFLEYPTSGTSRAIAPDDPIRTNALGEQPTSVTPCRTRTLTDLLEQYDPVEGIDFLNVDCEGLDLDVLRGLDWTRWTPRIIAVEANTPEARDEIVEYLAIKEFQLVARHLVTLIFLHESARDRVPLGLWR